MEIEGKIAKILPMKEGISKSTNNAWKMQSFILETDDRYQNKIYFEIFGEQKISEITLHEGEKVKVSFDLSSREFNENWFTSARVWKIEHLNQSQPQYPSSVAQPQQSNTPPPPVTESFNEEEENSDLPF